MRRIVYLGGLIPPNAALAAPALARRDRRACCARGPVPVTEVRAGMIIGPGSAAYEVIRDLVNHLPVMVTPRWVQLALDADRAARPARLPGRGRRHRRRGGPRCSTPAGPTP
ncbi:MAG: hypothetical protein MZV65_31380 [Chromatiales bacterium]|nr:hypothetical protein [Chromatiales bacterium]